MVDEEAAIFARYLVGRPAPADVVARYREAVARMFPDPPARRDRALLGFVTRHPWSTGPLDAAAALLAPGSRLRQRLLLMAALLETTPEGADAFLPREPRLGELMLRLPVIGMAAAARLLFGLVLFPIAAARA